MKNEWLITASPSSMLDPRAPRAHELPADQSAVVTRQQVGCSTRASAASATTDKDREEMTQIQRVQRGVVRVHAYVKPYNFIVPFETATAQPGVGSGVLVPETHLQAGGQGATTTYMVVLTCEHVVRGAHEVAIVLPMRGKAEIKGHVLSVCPDLDLALIGVELPSENGSLVNTLPFGNSDDVQPGQHLRAYGFPLGQKSLKVTDGVYSGYQNGYLQHSSPISSGNSGGPLLNAKHEVVGINRAIDARRNANNVGYAVPIRNFAILLDAAPPPRSLADFQGTRVVTRHSLGMLVHPATPAMLQYTGCAAACSEQGVVVRVLFERSPLRDAGIEEGDILTAIDGTPVDTKGEMCVAWDDQKVALRDYLERKKNSETVDLQFWKAREGRCVRVRSALVDVNQHCLRSVYPPVEPIEFDVFMGMVIMPLRFNHMEEMPQLFTYLTEKQQQRPYLVITHVLPGTMLYQDDVLQGGMLLEEVNGVPVRDLRDLRMALARPVMHQDGHRYCMLRTECKRVLVYGLREVVQEEERAAQEHLWPVDKQRLGALAQLVAASSSGEAAPALMRSGVQDVLLETLPRAAAAPPPPAVDTQDQKKKRAPLQQSVVAALLQALRGKRGGSA